MQQRIITMLLARLSPIAEEHRQWLMHTLSNPSVAYATAAGKLETKIGNQKWIALNNRG
jgi:hypothetical protein